ncbi:hypothetical protein [Streptomyces sp. NPDC050848]|uniref:hypothetical protein n=1 Tax=Streptomyces sp. NPDC050848 TaxID=3155791 RepID=UPI0033CC9B29
MSDTTVQQTETPAAPKPQGTHQWVLTLDMPRYGSASAHGTWTPPPGTTRHDAFEAIKADMVGRNPELKTANVVFFSIEPNTL